MIFKRAVQRYGRTPVPVTPYQRAGQLWDERIGSARVQARNWRLMAFGCLSLAGGLGGGVLWRSVQSIEIHLLMTGQIPLYSLKPTDLQYQYYGDPAVAGAAAPGNTARAVMPSQQGFDDHVLRREFSTVVSVRNYNP